MTADNPYQDWGHRALWEHAAESAGVILLPYKSGPLAAASYRAQSHRLDIQLSMAIRAMLGPVQVTTPIEVVEPYIPQQLHPDWSTLEGDSPSVTLAVVCKWRRGGIEHQNGFDGMPIATMRREAILEYLDLISYYTSLLHLDTVADATLKHFYEGEVRTNTARCLQAAHAMDVDLIKLAHELYMEGDQLCAGGAAQSD